MEWIMEPVSGFQSLDIILADNNCNGGASLQSCSCTGGLLVCDCSGGLKANKDG